MLNAGDNKKYLDKFIKGSFCGLANLEIASGIQGKIFLYVLWITSNLFKKNCI